MIVLVTQGDPAGIGPEVIVKALPEFDPPPDVEVRVLGDPEVLLAAAARADRPPPSRIEPVSGPFSAVAALEEAVGLVAAEDAAAIVTGPVNRARIREQGFAFPGQTEFLAERLGAETAARMLVADDLRVVPVTSHLPLRDVSATLTPDLVAAAGRTAWDALRHDFRIPAPRLGVLALNPHAGEGGRLGDEEGVVIRPAIETLRSEAIPVEGPLSPDGTFHPRVRARYDAILGMYHDQVAAPFRAATGGEGVAVTIGLPIIRTAPVHGTAEDIAGRGLADPTGFLRALELAVALAANRRR